MWPGHLFPVGRFSAHPGPTPAESAAIPAFEALEPIEPRMLLSADVSPFEVHTLSASPDVSTIKIAARRAASETSPTSRGMGQFTITRSGGSRNEPLTVNYTVNGTATPGDDYDGLSGSVIIPAGKNSATLDVLPVDDALAEDTEAVVVTLAEDAGYNLGSTSTQSATVRIADNEPTVKVTARRSASETNPTGRGRGQFTVTRSGGSKDSPLDVYYTIEGTASHGEDYQTLDGSVTIPADKTSVTIDIIPIDDVHVEDVETVVLALGGHEAYRLGPTSTQSATVRIADNEPVVKIVASKAAASETDPTNRGMGRFTVTRSGGSTDAPLILFLALHGSANPSTDYVSLPGVVVIPSGQRSTTIEVTPIDDGEAEVVETVTLTIIGTSLYRLGPESTRSATVRIADNEPTVRITATRQASEKDPTTKGMGRFTVTRSGGSTASDLTVYYTVEGTAAPGDDYQPLIGSVVIPAGQKSATIDVVPIADTELDDRETVVVSLTTDTSYNLGNSAQSTATVKIANALGVDFLAVTGFGTAGGNWNYNLTFTGGRGAASAYTIDYGLGTYHYTTNYISNNGDLGVVTQECEWVSKPDGVWYDYSSAELDALLAEIDGEVDIPQMQICPPILAGSFTGSSPMSIGLGDYGSLSGTATITTSLVGLENVTVPAGKFTAYKITMKVKESAKGTIYPFGDDEGYGMSATGNTLNTFWAVPGVGVVKYTMNTSVRASVSGHGSAGMAVNLSMLLTDYEV